MRFKLFLLCLLMLPGLSQAYWTGIGAYLGQSDTDWLFNANAFEADTRRYGLHIEERTEPGLRVGAGLGQFSVRLRDLQGVEATEKFNGEFLEFYLSWPFEINQNLTLHSRLDYQFNLGSPSGSEDENEDIDWNEAGLTLGIAIRLGIISLRPFINWREIDGDTTTNNSTRTFSEEESQISGLILDIYVEPTGYVRLKSTLGKSSSIWLGFIREY